MKKPLADYNKAIIVIKFILAHFDGKPCGFHKLFKILYFSERQHLANYGRSITGDKYIAMEAGPVPSVIYDMFKALKENELTGIPQSFADSFVVHGRDITMVNSEFNLDYLSESEMECIKESIMENRKLGFGDLKEKSHDTAWKHAVKNGEMSITDIARAGGANEELVNYIQLLTENRSLKLN